MESVALKLFGDIYRGKRVLITGHTGFKGSWLALWLKELGAEITGVALPPDTYPNHWTLLNVDLDDQRIDIRDLNAVARLIKKKKPEIIFHLAAQPLVRRAYRDPVGTWSTNVMGTVHVLEACRAQSSVQAVVVATTDKCYENLEWPWGYRELDRLGGHDPYSASKAAVEFVVGSYRRAFFNGDSGPLIATARAGNVIGGGDWSEDRLIPDLIRAYQKREAVEIRFPHATRPWQHVLEPLSGYLCLGQRLLLGDRLFADAWNFGPNPRGNLTVEEVLTRIRGYWSELRWLVTDELQPHESGLLYLDSAKARSLLRWQPVWDVEDTIEKTIDWYRHWIESGEVVSHSQLSAYIADAALSSAAPAGV
jgi:CDP-glucose 4,6-dehydratase